MSRSPPLQPLAGNAAAQPSVGSAPAWIRGRAVDQIPTAVLLVLCAFAALMSDRFLSSANLSNVLLQAAVLAVITVGMTYVIIGGGFDLSVGSVVALAGCIGAEVMLQAGITAGVAAGLLAGVAVGLVNGTVVAYLGVSPFIATLATMVLVRGVVLLITNGAPVVGEEGLPQGFLDYGTSRFLGLPLLVWTAAAVFVVFAWILHRTAYGTRIYATGGSREAAFLSGVPVRRISLSTYVVSGLTAGIAGVMLASRLQSGQPTAGEFYELNSIAAVVLGGAALHGGEGKLYKSMVGVLIMVVLANSLNLIGVDSYWQRVTIGLVIVAAAAADQLRRRRR
ncbi:ABC transporter permease [Ramlibacter sp. AW1]|uniref:ABC transporter permease n=1 Tax=Ramlibacter aurantiacus TaxID=2801330 RepID=A0A937D2Q1_9BURK|nr:ABC transporter permease [Ramlibacter aurantiacus]MBL0421849.1 ABC transporter permease [Ramlibacter aurantiacus]